ncbi:collagenase-like [Maniola hyperantus]|uniref:collagenase-like n=1 Tax=Aphantopus hyperantus TaxID=2795564 RepID=UPI001568AD30|nr:collagenase-like [Maniola hyperantus]
MKFLLVVAALALAAEAYEPIMYNYHEEIGIPMAARIKAAEEAMDFDGSRIAGGSHSALGAHPHVGGLVITLTDNRQSVCGSSLLSNTRLVTAAHCWRHRTTQARQFTVVLGSIRLFSGGQRINTNQVEMHAQYNQNNLNNDVAMVRINHVGFTNHINRILIPSGSNQYVGVWAVAAGFGATGDNIGISHNQVKSHVSLQVITNAVCARTYGTSTVVASTICVATPGGRSTCGGDSGGPLAIGSGNNRELIGITSFGHTSGCTRGHPAGFMRVTSIASWIRQRM